MKKLFLLIAIICVNVGVAQDFKATINSYMDTNRSALGLQDQDIEGLNIDSQSYSKSMDVHNVWVTQQFNSIDIFNSTSSFAVKNGTVVNASLSFISTITEKVNTTSPSISPAMAITNAANALGIQSPSDLVLLETLSDHSFIYSNANISLENIPVKLVYQHTQDEKLRLAWDLSIYLLDASHYYSVRIDAV
jgi:hypothetical protein